MNRKLYIFGAGEFAQIARDYFQMTEKYVFKNFIVDDEYLTDDTPLMQRQSILPFSFAKDLLLESDTDVFVAISAGKMSTQRQIIYEKLKVLGCSFAKYVSPHSFVSKSSQISDNVFVFEGNVIQNDVFIGSNTILWSGNHIGHRSEIGENVFVSSHVVVSGYCKVGNNSYLGVNSTLIDNLHIAPFTLVGAGSLMIRDSEEKSVYVGSPAKRIPSRNPLEVKLG